MKVEDLKQQLIGQIHITDDNEVLEFMLDFRTQDNKSAPYNLTTEQHERISIALEQIKTGQVISEEEEQKQTLKWLAE
jgi:hypothetical protein